MKVVVMYSTHAASREHVERLRQLGLEVQVVGSEPQALSEAVDADVVLGHRYLRQILPVTTRLKWVQSTAAGPEHLPLLALRDQGVALTRNPFDSEAIAFHAVALASALLRRVGMAPGECCGVPACAMVLGTGAIGGALARLLRSIGVQRIHGVNRDGRSVVGFDAVWSSRDWRAGLGGCELLFDCLPEGALKLDAEAFRRLPEASRFVSVGRFENLVFEDLDRALRSGQLAGAALDTEKCVLEAGSAPPNLILTPHVASHDEGRGERLEAAIELQVRRFLDGTPLLGRVF